ncbi:MAG: hypothetical protein ACYTGP_02980 [Planctomycetota bacterium]
MRTIVSILLIATLTACGKTNPGNAKGGAKTTNTTTAPAAGTAATPRPPATRPATDDLPEDDLRRRIFDAHGGDIWLTKGAISGRINVEYTGTDVVTGRFFLEPGTSRARIDLDNGSSMIWDGEKAWTTGRIQNPGQVRFHVRAWLYFMALPFKLADPGTIYEPKEKRSLLWQDHETGRIEFEPGVGDSADWFWFYAQPGTNLLQGTGFSVTYGLGPNDPRPRDQSLIYEAFETIDGVTFSTHYRVHAWLETGPGGTRTGNISIDELEFVDPPPGTFTAPPGATEDPVRTPEPAPPPKPAEPAGPARDG